MTEEPTAGHNGTLAMIVKQTGLPSTLKGHAQRVIIRWLAGTIAHPYFQNVRENLDTIEGRSRVNMMLAEEVGRQALTDPEQIERAKARFLGDTFRKQENVEAVATAAAVKIEAQADAETEGKPAEEPSADFMNAFTHEAENASSEQLRDRLAAILAGEIKRPGTFSKSVLRLAGEIDQQSLAQFHKVLENRVQKYIVTPPDWNTGEMYITGLHLSDLGLVSGASGTSHNFKPDENLNGFMVGTRHGIVIKFKVDTAMMQSSIWILTKVGLCFANLLPETDERIPLRRLATELDKANVRQIVVGRVTPISGEKVNVSYDEIVYSEPAHHVGPVKSGLIGVSAQAPPIDFKNP
ncbi:DUF2806 domain-containing protein [Sphingomonas sp.]|uniref:DUF2806 domain-containing protein n=1 Tax=Sphingomonas sp. TaxID=28214 RepID=UPI002EDB3966